MAKILENITKIAEKEGITVGALERAIGASKGVLSRAISNGTDIQAKWLVAIVENYPLYSADWLLTGRGDMVKAEQPAAGNTDPATFMQLVDTIRQQAQEIGQLKERIAQLEREGGKRCFYCPQRDSCPRRVKVINMADFLRFKKKL